MEAKGTTIVVIVVIRRKHAMLSQSVLYIRKDENRAASMCDANSAGRRFCSCNVSMLAKWHIVRVNSTDRVGEDVCYRSMPMAEWHII